jgi:hypothetical protein
MGLLLSAYNALIITSSKTEVLYKYDMNAKDEG